MPLNPFAEDTAPLTQDREAWRRRLESVDVTGLHAEAHAILAEEFDKAMAQHGGDVEDPPESHLLLLRAPRAGYGKTHLLSRVASSSPKDTIFFPVEFRSGTVGWPTVLRSFVNHLTETDGGAIGSSLSRRLVGELLARLLERGDIKAKHAKSAVPLLRSNAPDIFTKDADANPVVRWFVSNFSALRPILVKELGRATGLSEVHAEFWFDTLRGIDMPEEKTRKAARLRAMFLPENEATVVAARERVCELCIIARLLAPVAILADELDLLYGDPESGLRLASLVEELRDRAPGLVIVLSMNRDVWDSAFGGKLPSALEDRFTAHAVDLKPADRDLLEEVVRQRCVSSGMPDKEIDVLLDRAESAIMISDSPRSAIRHARHWWESKDHDESDSVGSDDGSDDDEDGGMESFLLGPENGNGAPVGGAEEFIDEPDVREGDDIFPEAEAEEEEFPGSGETEPPVADRVAESNFSPFENAGKSGLTGFSPTDEPPAVRRFREVQGDVLTCGDPVEIEGETLRQIIRLTGQASPLVEVSEVNLNGSIHPRTADAITRWKFPENEIVFSFRSLSGDVEESWARLSQYVESRNGSAPSKVVVFSNESLHDSPAYQWLDIVDLDTPAKATLTAAATVLAESASSKEALDEAFRQISPLLDPFWRRVTRPLASKG